MKTEEKAEEGLSNVIPKRKDEIDCQVMPHPQGG
jgi:hypothetical protein